MAKKTTAAQKARFSAYSGDGRREKNRAAKLARHVKAHPEDAQSKKAVGRKLSKKNAPKTKGNFPPAKPMVLVDSAGKPIAKAVAQKVVKNSPRVA